MLSGNNETWHAGRPRPWPHGVRRGPSCSHVISSISAVGLGPDQSSTEMDSMVSGPHASDLVALLGPGTDQPSTNTYHIQHGLQSLDFQAADVAADQLNTLVDFLTDLQGSFSFNDRSSSIERKMTSTQNQCQKLRRQRGAKLTREIFVSIKRMHQRMIVPNAVRDVVSILLGVLLQNNKKQREIPFPI